MASTASTVFGINTPAQAQRSLPPDAQALASEITASGSAPLIVTFGAPGYSPEAMQQAQTAEAQEASIAATQSALLSRMAPFGVTNVKTFPYVPQMAFTVSSLEALQALYADPAIVNVQEDVAVPPALLQSVPKIRADDAHALLFKGQGQTVAILDTGVYKTHAKLAGKVASEACYSTNDAVQNISSLCPGGVTSSIATGSGVNCAGTVIGCDHGTHVAGIASAVAPSATLIAIQVFSRYTDSATSTPCVSSNDTSPCTRSRYSDQIAALNRVYALRTTYNIAAVNMSLGGGNYPATCDTNPLKPSIDLLRTANIATVISAGNADYRNAMSAPACISSAVSVAASDDFDKVASFSNLSGITTLFAPGANINSTVPFNASGSKSGTSMAAPHVAGAIAVLKQINPGLTVNTLVSLLATNGPLITDQRSGGFVSKRRLDVYEAMCDVISCDADDFRILTLNAALNGSISAATDRDLYTFNGVAGNKLTLTMNRTSGNVDPYLELFDPDGVRIALNDNGGGAPNALISGLTLVKTGKYIITASSRNGSAGNYSLSASQQAVALNPVPRIDLLQPASATGMANAGDFWVKVYGQNFNSQTRFAWNAETMTWAPIDSGSAWVKVRGINLAQPWPRTAYIYAYNPAPGGGYSNIASFAITDPSLGASELVSPSANSTATVGVKTGFVISWTHPTDSWRTMQNMDLRLRDQDGNAAAWIRVVERAGNTSVYRLLNSAQNTPAGEDALTPAEGLPGENKNLTITDTVTLHLADSAFSGSGRTAIMSPTVTFGPNATGVYNIEFRVDGPNGEVQDDDVLGVMAIAPSACPIPVTGAAVSGATTSIVNTDYAYTVAITPSNATAPISITWSPEPKSGQGTSTAIYNWLTAGEQAVFAGVENCGSFAADLRTVKIHTTTNPDLAISKSAPAIALAGEPITYTLTITNRGATTANDLSALDVLPVGATWVSGGIPVGNFVQWLIPSLDGYGAMTQTTFVVKANATITNTSYGVSASGGFNATGTQPVVTSIVDAKAKVTSLDPASLNALGVSVAFLEGAVADDTEVALDVLSGPSQPLPSGVPYAGRAFRLDAYQSNMLASGLTLGEAMSITITYSDADAAGMDESRLALYHWTNSQWTTSGITCTPNPPGNSLTCSVATPLGEFVLAVRQTMMYLPLISRDFPLNR
jgi:uncharacterized repeat protein (TIGR01451 family)